MENVYKLTNILFVFFREILFYNFFYDDIDMKFSRLTLINFRWGVCVAVSSLISIEFFHM